MSHIIMGVGIYYVMCQFFYIELFIVDKNYYQLSECFQKNKNNDIFII